jgi:hypothetical protein
MEKRTDNIYIVGGVMKRRLLEAELKKWGWRLLRHGSNHDVWTNGIDL